ncbi:adhesive plaque matrix protein 2 [Nephila pilipes]|uniref:Adhesive plaque matrix protein 2 n=1 Tax=Nephila pilipes TaxID=299642 RepID=A0A8X6PQU6_NEPPI|nr:adhesive plaque matrix protein 2 [Nephila pilipes]
MHRGENQLICLPEMEQLKTVNVKLRSEKCICMDLCNPDKCLHGKCEVIELDYKCRCDDGYTGLHCEEKVKTKLNNQLLWPAILISVNIVVCILLFGIFCLLCSKRK